MPDTEAVSFERLFTLYNIDSPSDISSISEVNSWYEKEVVEAVITDVDVISNFYRLSLLLQDYSFGEYHDTNYGHIKTEELIKAYNQNSQNTTVIMIETIDRLRFCLEYDTTGSWLSSNNGE